MDKNKLKEELVDLRMKLANAETQALEISHRVQADIYHWGLVRKARGDIQKADNKLCELAKLLGLDKIGLVEQKLGNWGQGEPKWRSKKDAK